MTHPKAIDLYAPLDGGPLVALPERCCAECYGPPVTYVVAGHLAAVEAARDRYLDVLLAAQEYRAAWDLLANTGRNTVPRAERHLDAALAAVAAHRMEATDA